jgi:hypothetical protein
MVDNTLILTQIKLVKQAKYVSWRRLIRIGKKLGGLEKTVDHFRVYSRKDEVSKLIVYRRKM